MLKGNLKCSEINKLLIRYINFDLNKKDSLRVAIHLRNCPKCMEKYSSILKRKNELKKIFIEIEKKIRMQNEISSYIDMECGDDSRFIIEAMLICDEDYKKEFEEVNNLKNMFKITESEILNSKKTNYTQKILAKERYSNYEKIKLVNKLIPFMPYIKQKFANLP